MRALLVDKPNRVWTNTTFSSVPVTGWWRYRDRFQILPVPAGAPTLSQLVGDHPFILEVSYPGAPDWPVDAKRARTATREVNRLLAGLLLDVDDRTGHFSRSEWVYVPVETEGAPLRLDTRFAQLGYALEGLQVKRPNFSDASGDYPSITHLPDSDYYGRRGIAVDDTLALPRSIEVLLDRYFAADPATQERVQRWCHWLNHSRQVWALSASASHIAVIQAVEALMPAPTSGTRCECCGLIQGAGPTQRFAEFLDEFAPGPEQAEGRKELYALRSALSHGGKLLSGELAGAAFSDFTPKTWEERSKLDLAHRLARIVGVNWLMSLDPPALEI
jgi:hypothetical protein